MLDQYHPTLLDATCWPRLNTMLDDVSGLSLSLLKIFVQHRRTLLDQQSCSTMLALFEQAYMLYCVRRVLREPIRLKNET